MCRRLLFLFLFPVVLLPAQSFTVSLEQYQSLLLTKLAYEALSTDLEKVVNSLQSNSVQLSLQLNDSLLKQESLEQSYERSEQSLQIADEKVKSLETYSSELVLSVEKSNKIVQQQQTLLDVSEKKIKTLELYLKVLRWITLGSLIFGGVSLLF